MGEIKVQVVPDPAKAGQLMGRTQTEKLSDRIDELSESIGSIANSLRSRLEQTLQDDEAAWKLDEISLNFSLDLEAEAGVVVAKAKTTAGFEAQLTWRR
jgi:uncharacterized phage infection (PIP) family protein YhgE